MKKINRIRNLLNIYVCGAKASLLALVEIFSSNSENISRFSCQSTYLFAFYKKELFTLCL